MLSEVNEFRIIVQNFLVSESLVIAMSQRCI